MMMSCEVPELPKSPLLKAMLAEAKYDEQKRFEDFIESLPAMKRRESNKEIHLPLFHFLTAGCAKDAQVTDEESVRPRWNYSEYPGIYYYFCGKCGGGIDEGQEYCPYCKTKQNWIVGVPKCINPIRL